MLYKPKYCCNCGEKVERVDWNVLTSRRFCEACAVENKRHDYLPRILVGGGVLAAMFGFGSLFGGPGQGGEVMNSRVSSPAALSRAETKKTAETEADQKTANEPSSPPTQNKENSVPDSAASAISSSLKQTNETQHYCGALTKKGTPCSRKVKAAGLRCFQHEGKPPAPAQNQ